MERLCGLTGSDLEVPRLSPDAVVEVLSPDDRRADVDDTIATYLAERSTLVVVIDPGAKTVELHDETSATILGVCESLMHAALPGFELSVSALFQTIAPPR